MPEPTNKNGTALDRLLSGLDAMSQKLDSIGKRVEAVEGLRAKPPQPLVTDNGDGDDVDDLPDAALIDDPDLTAAPLGEEGKPKPAAADSLQAIRGRRARLAAFQARADATCALFGETAPRPLQGETVGTYARRITRRWQPLSPQWANIALDGLSGQTLAVAINQILEAAADEAKHPKVPKGYLMERKTSDGNGHFVTSFYGSPSTWMNQFAGRRRFVEKVNLKPSQGFTST